MPDAVIDEGHYRKLVGSLDLKQIQLSHLSADLYNPFSGVPDSLRAEVTAMARIIGITSASVAIEGRALVEASTSDDESEDLSTEENDEDTSESANLFKIDCRFILLYDLDLAQVPDIFQEGEELVETKVQPYLNAFAQSTAALNFWPYVRETISSITGKMGLNPLVLPLYKNIRT